MGLFSNDEKPKKAEDGAESWKLLTEKRLEELSEQDRYFYVGLVASLIPYYSSKNVASLNEHQKSARDLHNSFHMALFKTLADRTKLPTGRLASLQLVAEGEVEKDFQMFSDSLSDSSKGTNWLVMQDLVCLCLISGRYDARSRTLIRRVVAATGVEWQQVFNFENNLAHMLLSDFQESAEEAAEREMKEKNSKWKRYAAVAGATIGGGVVIGLTAGLAAPFIAAGAGAVLGAGTTAFLASTGGVVLITTLFGGAGAKLTGQAMSNRKGEVKEFDFVPLRLLNSHTNRDTSNEDKQKDLSVVITVSGLLSHESDNESDSLLTKMDQYALPWKTIDAVGETYTVFWESEELEGISRYMGKLLSNKAIGYATTQVLSQTVLHAAVAAVALPVALLNVTDVIDNAWSRCVSRADQAGLILADTLCARVQGFRPVTLVGFGLGARMIFRALEDMAKRKVPAVGIVERVVLCGCPIPRDSARWATVRGMVSGRFVNAYSKTDWILGYVYRTLNAESSVAGLDAVILDNVYGKKVEPELSRGTNFPGGIIETTDGEKVSAEARLDTVDALGVIENVDVTHLVPGHLHYRTRMPYILYELGLSSTEPPPLTEQEKQDIVNLSKPITDDDKAKLETELEENLEKNMAGLELEKQKVAHLEEHLTKPADKVVQADDKPEQMDLIKQQVKKEGPSELAI
ncbi:hypothetical protein SARC_06665 [Sphaeroforma arctica JP610]|uniref:DUF726 domain-containing protein n=1 Tax=Sphaeroforma arctica JP610 TaxID=667725 RepID=A0A0L0FWQ1_9EUKA|nr:hypothetical protein SARC_06665 [Sphaeroforma arctica JP610]KNC80991.1 hypothetical protein SARC_06665 [Sphaeroforma arctica JP610]|eukprot:XP_014154893.1 hypothetical protein SARC_06665 [Sphaeroforma arctica JP610]